MVWGMRQVAVEDLTRGTIVDLEDDGYAQEASDEIDLIGRRYAYSVVDYIDRETDRNVVVYFENDIPVSFPVGHKVSVDRMAEGETSGS